MWTDRFLQRWVPAVGCLAAAVAQAQPTTPQFVSYLSGFNTPIGIFHSGDSTGRLFVIQQGGQVRVVRDGSLRTAPLLSLSSSSTCLYPGNPKTSVVGFTSGGERGLLGLAFHPQFAGSGAGRGRLFVSFTDQSGDSMLVRYTMADPAADTLSAPDLATCTVILRVDQDYANHNGGHIAFGPGGYLYFGLGDGGSGGDPCQRAQTLNPSDLASFDGVDSGCPADAAYTGNGGDPNSRALLGKMLRLDVNTTTAALSAGNLCGRPRVGQPVEYGIPIGQPGSADGSLSTACDEVWSYGLRNPWRWSFDRSNSDLLIGDVGQGNVEEVNYEPVSQGGRNYGWRCREGNTDYNTAGCGSPVVAFTEPVLAYSHAGGRCSITGGYVYRGSVLGVQGRYFYGDYCTGEVWAATQSGGSWSTPGSVFQNLANPLASFGEDQQGDLYATQGGEIWILDGPRAPGDPIFLNGFE